MAIRFGLPSFLGGKSALEQEILSWVDEVWYADPHANQWPIRPGWWLLAHPDDPHRCALDESLRRLEQRCKPVELGRLAAEAYFGLSVWQATQQGDRRVWAVLAILGALLAQWPPTDVPARIEARLRELFRSPFAGSGVPPHSSSLQYRNPTVADCLGLLTALPPTPERLYVAERLVRGKLNDAPLAMQVLVRFQQGGFRHFDSEIMHSSGPVWQILFDAGRFDYATFREALAQVPGLALGASLATNDLGLPGWLHQHLSPNFSQLLIAYCDRLAGELADDLSDDNAPILVQIRGLRGSRYLIAAGRQHARLKLGKLVYQENAYRQDASGALLHLARALDVEPSEPAERAALLAELRALPPATLKALLPIAIHGRVILAEALGWERALLLIDEIDRMARLRTARHSFEADLRNSPDVEVGVVELAAARAALAEAGEALAREVLTLFRQARVGADNVVTLLEAVAGWNRDRVPAGLAKHNQTSIKAYGLLPLDPGRASDEALERYVRLKQSFKDARQFGAQRQANQQAAVQVALANLAQVAGFADVTRLEWAMEGRLAGGAAAVGQSWDVAEYRIALRLSDDEMVPELVLSKGASPLKSVPAAIRKHAAYAEAKEALTLLREQASRFRSALEAAMAHGDTFSRDDLAGLVRLPVARWLLERLVLQVEGGAFGLPRLDGERLVLEALDGSVSPLDDRRVVVAHPYHLFQNGLLADWQRAMVRRRVVQPFKQVYRELYLVTPAEQETRTFSNRFAGHALDSRVAGRLLQARGWQVDSGDAAQSYKPLPRARLKALLNFADAGHFLSETDVITSDRISFVHYPPRRLDPRSRYVDQWKPLDDVPPLVFSEVMRDVDLVVSVAQCSGEARLSEEAYQRRAEIVTTLLDEMGLQGVSANGHFAHVQGRLARYRVHLGSGTIHIEPGNYLCVVPDRTSRGGEPVYLPFADQGDAKVSEVVSKVLLLANDDRIADLSILRQINAATGQLRA